jgi:hypothetical protein
VDVETNTLGEDRSIQLGYSKIDPDGSRESFEYRIALTTTPCFFGGERFWFSCPFQRNGSQCERRVGVLYMGERYFGCRKCLNLAYESQQETHTEFFKTLREAFVKPLPILRIKYWKGRVTKKYSRLLKHRDSQCHMHVGDDALTI